MGGGGMGGGGMGGGGMGGGGMTGGGRTGVMTLQSALGSPNDEWSVLSPRIQKISDAQTQLSSATIDVMSGGRTRIPMGGTTGATTGQPSLATAFTELYNTCGDPNATDEVIKAKLAVYRQAKKQIEDNRTRAQEELRSVVTLRQEAILISLGYLD
jgi:hypothetical protein